MLLVNFIIWASQTTDLYGTINCVSNPSCSYMAQLYLEWMGINSVRIKEINFVLFVSFFIFPFPNKVLLSKKGVANPGISSQRPWKKGSLLKLQPEFQPELKTFTFPVSTFLSYHTFQSRLQRLRLEAKSSTSTLFRKFMKIQQDDPGLLQQKAQPLRFFSHHPRFFYSLLGMGWNHYAGKGRDTKKSHILAPSVITEQGVCAL